MSKLSFLATLLASAAVGIQAQDKELCSCSPTVFTFTLWSFTFTFLTIKPSEALALIGTPRVSESDAIAERMSFGVVNREVFMTRVV